MPVDQLLSDIQAEIDRIFDLFNTGSIGRREYVAAIDPFRDEIPKDVLAGIVGRSDRRSLGEFALHIYDKTVREHFLSQEWAKLLGGFGLRFEDHGIENSGRLLLKDDGFLEADFLLHFPAKTYRMEMKFGPSQLYATYVRDRLIHACGQDDFVMLTVLANNDMIGPNGDPRKDTPLKIPYGLCWFLADRVAIRKILAEGEHGNHKGFGGKPTVRLHARQFDGVFGGLHAWTEVEPIELLSAH